MNTVTIIVDSAGVTMDSCEQFRADMQEEFGRDRCEFGGEGNRGIIGVTTDNPSNAMRMARKIVSHHGLKLVDLSVANASQPIDAEG